MSSYKFVWLVALLAVCIVTVAGSANANVSITVANPYTDGTYDEHEVDFDDAEIKALRLLLIGDANLDGDVDVWQFDGGGDVQLWLGGLGLETGATWSQGDFNGDGDVDLWQLDGNGDGQLLLEHLGETEDVRADQGAGTAEALYNVATGELFFDVGTGVGIVGIGSAELYVDNIDPFFTTLPLQINGTSLAFFNSSGLPTGEDSVGLMLPAGLAQEDMTFSYTPIGSGTITASVTMIVPEPSTITMAVLGLGILGVFWRRRRA